MLRLVSAFSLDGRPERAARAAADDLVRALGAPPRFVIAFTTEHLAAPEFTAQLRDSLGGAPVFGGTSCRGLLTERGFHSGPDGAAGLLGFAGDDGDYGVGAAKLNGDPAAAAASALSQAIQAAGRPFETPSLVLTIQPPGAEEAILEGLTRVAGPNCPVLGGSSADEALAGAWRQFANGEVLRDHVVAAALFSSAPVGLAFQSGYAPTERAGCVTDSEGRTIRAIDGRPAAEVYSEWTGGAIPAETPAIILAQAAWAPLGRRVAETAAYDEYVLSHPSEVTPEGFLRTFTDVAPGDELVVMEGSEESLVRRGGRVAADALEIGGLEPAQAAGALMIFCGGCMMAVEQRIGEMGEGVAEALDGRPFLCAFTFGEQGALVSRQNRHGNLMVAAGAFGAAHA